MTEAGGISPPLAEVLARAARVWQAFMAGRSLDRALAEVVPDDSRLRQATQDVSYAAVRRRAFSERVIAELAARAPSNGVRALLSVALPQLLTDRHAPYAIVDQAVTAARADQSTAFAAGFVNALQRNFLRQQSGIVERLNRDQTRLDLLLCDPATIICRSAAAQSAPTWVDLADDFLFLPDGGARGRGRARGGGGESETAAGAGA